MRGNRQDYDTEKQVERKKWMIDKNYLTRLNGRWVEHELTLKETTKTGS